MFDPEGAVVFADDGFAFVHGDVAVAVAGVHGEHREAHTEVGCKDLVSEEVLDLFVIVSGIDDSVHGRVVFAKIRIKPEPPTAPGGADSGTPAAKTRVKCFRWCRFRDTGSENQGKMFPMVPFQGHLMRLVVSMAGPRACRRAGHATVIPGLTRGISKVTICGLILIIR